MHFAPLRTQTNLVWFPKISGSSEKIAILGFWPYCSLTREYDSLQSFIRTVYISAFFVKSELQYYLCVWI
jgi:hypothetical protein